MLTRIGLGKQHPSLLVVATSPKVIKWRRHHVEVLVKKVVLLLHQKVHRGLIARWIGLRLVYGGWQARSPLTGATPAWVLVGAIGITRMVGWVAV